MKANVPTSMYVAFDALFVAMFLTIAGPPAAALVAVHQRLALAPIVQALLLPLGVLLYLVGLCAMAWLVRNLLPKLEAGIYAVPKDRGVIVWLLHFALMRVMYLPVWRPLMFSTTTLRTLMLRALGARVAFGFQSSSDPVMLDPSLIAVERDAQISAGVVIACHAAMGRTLTLAPVRIGRGAQLLESVKVGPGVYVGDGSIVGAECLIGPGCTVGGAARLGPGCWLHSDVQIGDAARIGHGVTIDRGVIVGARAKIAAGATLDIGTVVPAGGSYP